MPINWDEFEKDIDADVAAAAGKTDAQLASKISSVTRLTDEEVATLFPEPGDAKKVAELMCIVKSAEDRNKKISNIISNSEKFASITLTLFEKFL